MIAFFVFYMFKGLYFVGLPGIPTISLLRNSIDLQKTEMFMEVPLVIRLVNYPQ